MIRLIVAIAAVLLALDCNTAEAQRHRAYSPSSHLYGPEYAYPIYDYGMVYGYVYDPYARGRFEMHDPTNDPYLRAKYKYDTFFPGRRSRQTRFFRRR